jgi:hypothetical protein
VEQFVGCYFFILRESPGWIQNFAKNFENAVSAGLWRAVIRKKRDVCGEPGSCLDML